jgi:hypothetical protein
VRKHAFIILAFMMAGCLPARYTVVQDSNPAAAVTAANTVFVAWLPVDPNRFAARGYSSAAEYAKVIATMNGEMQKGLKNDWPKKNFVFARTPVEPPPAGVDMIVAFQGADVTEGSGGGHSGITITTAVKFFDPKAQREVKSAQITASTRGINGWTQYNLEGCLEQAAYNVGVYVGETLTGNQ